MESNHAANFLACSIPFRKVYLQSHIDVIDVIDNQIRIKGSKDVLERAVFGGRMGFADEYEVALPRGNTIVRLKPLKLLQFFATNCFSV